MVIANPALALMGHGGGGTDEGPSMAPAAVVIVVPAITSPVIFETAPSATVATAVTSPITSASTPSVTVLTAVSRLV
ncbi:MAG: hypothetical protein ACI9UN_005433 [Granulosicoccus sp.]|jgi:hypothetical protein